MSARCATVVSEIVARGSPRYSYNADSVCVFITAGPIIKLCAGGEGDSEGHVL